MNFVEKLFHVSPDGGNGMFEVACMVILLTPLILIVAASSRRMLSKLPRRTACSVIKGNQRFTSVM